MSAQNNGGPAFPTYNAISTCDEGGMTLRDYFAAKAMQALIASNGTQIQEHHPEGVLIRPARVAIPPLAYEYADAMLAARGDA